ncbi:MAG: hypothetical protein AB1609_04945 [Bacillota bacterium]
MVAGAFVISLGVMVGAQRWLAEQRTQPALLELQQIPGVSQAWLSSDGGVRSLWVEVSPAEDLPGLVTALERVAASGRVGRVDEVVLVDQRTPSLVAAYNHLSLALQEGAVSGAFTDMADRVYSEAKTLGVPESRVYVDSGNVYLLLKDRDAFLIEVVPRPLPAGRATVTAKPALRVRAGAAAPYSNRSPVGAGGSG